MSGMKTRWNNLIESMMTRRSWTSVKQDVGQVIWKDRSTFLHCEYSRWDYIPINPEHWMSMRLVKRTVLKSMQVIPCSDRSQWDYILYPQARKSMKNISENFLGIYSWYFFRKDFRYFIWNLVEESTARVDRNIISLRVWAVGDLRWAAQGLLFGSDSSWTLPPCLLL